MSSGIKNICMAGIDHVRASVDNRMLFSFTEANQHKIIRSIMEKHKPDGCVLISTCNRTELWLSGNSFDPMQILCDVSGLNVADHKEFFVERKNEVAAKYLFELTCGLHSLVFGEDQILTQVRDSLAMSREMKSADALLDKLFSSAVSVGKKVKTNVSFRGASRSVAERGVYLLEEVFTELTGINCVVIGNGEMGRIAAKILVNKGANVSVTVRQYKHKKLVVPEGCLPIPYEDRMLYIASADAVISATTSPHLTVTADKFPANNNKCTLVDLAMPRDIDPDIANLKGISIYDLDDLGTPAIADVDGLDLASEIIAESLDKFIEWYNFRKLSLAIHTISENTAIDAASRALHECKSLDVAELSQVQLFGLIEKASKKAVSSLFYGLKNETDSKVTKEIIESLEKSVSQKTRS